MNTNVVPISKDQRGDFTASEIELIKTQIAPGASDAELKLFISVSQHLGLDPMKRQLYAIQRSGKMTIQVSVDGLLAIAERSGQFAGVTAPQFCGDDGDWRDVWFKGIPAAAKIGVMRRGWREPVWGVAVMREYAQDNSMWKTKPTHMLEKCALAKALRRAFPNEFSEVTDATDVRATDDYDSFVDETTGEIVEDAAVTAVEAQDAAIAPAPVVVATDWKDEAQACWARVKAWAGEHNTDPQRLRFYLATADGVPDKVTTSVFKAWLDAVGPDFDALFELYVAGEDGSQQAPLMDGDA